MERVIKTKKDAEKYIFQPPYFAFLDVLGFKSLVKNNSHKTLVKLYKELIRYPVTAYNVSIENEQKEIEKTLGEKFNPTGLRLVNISDSIMLWTSNNREHSLFELIYTVKLLMAAAFIKGIPLRGTIVMGDIEVMEQENNLSIIGKGLVHAYSREEDQQWSGCIVDNGIFTFLRSFNREFMQLDKPLRIEKYKDLIIETDVPLKEDKTIKSYVVNWADNLNLSDKDIYKSFGKFKKRLKESEIQKNKTEIIIANTISFNKYVKSLHYEYY
jgi:hypothetical protein